MKTDQEKLMQWYRSKMTKCIGMEHPLFGLESHSTRGFISGTVNQVSMSTKERIIY